jgi:hypothetical protein
MTKEQKKNYQNVAVLKEIMSNTFTGAKFRLDCGHHITFNHNLGNDITIYNGKELKIVCSQCGY